jgi:hypothetical protein
MIRLPAVPSVVLDSFVQVMLSMLHAALAPVDVFCVQARRGEEEERGRENSRSQKRSSRGRLCRGERHSLV